MQQYKAGKISPARYGYREVETGFIIYRGGCEDPEHPQGMELSRKKHMEYRAFMESFCYSLDVNDYRDHLCLSADMISDEQLLQSFMEVMKE